MFVRKSVYLALLVVLGMSVVANADTIGPNCATCNGATYTLTYNPTPVASDSTTQTFEFFYNIDVNGFNAAALGSTVYLEAVAVKPSNDILDPSTMAFAPGGVGDWSNPLITGSLNANACSDNSGNAFACAQAVSLGSFNQFTVGTSKTFSFGLDIRMGTGTLMTADSIKAEFVDAHGNKIGSLLSENITASRSVPAPEPTSLALFGGGFAVLATLRKRRTR
jgi:hypothetical protein